MGKIILDVQPDAVNERFLPYLTARTRFELYWGGRDSSKSDFVALKFLLKCMTQKYFKCVLVRKVFDTIKDSQVATIRKVAEREGLDKYFFFGSSPLEIRCLLNGNKFICRGMDNPDKLKSISDPTDAWYEEANQIEEQDFNVLSTSLRTSYEVPIQEVFTFNPDHEGDYKKFWIYKKFFASTGNENGLSFSGKTTSRVYVNKQGQLEEREITVPFSVMHSTYADNRWCPPERAAQYESYKHTDPYLYKVWALGLWAAKLTGAEFYTSFKREKHVGPFPYLPEHQIIHLTYDFNSLPYMTQIGIQAIRDEATRKTQIRIFKEWCLRPPNNTAAAVTQAFRREFEKKGISVYYYGDASGKSRIPGKGDERAFDDIEAGLFQGGFLHNSSDRVAKRNTNVLKRRDFINALLEGNKWPDIQICIDESCTETIQDFESVKMDMYGKVKERVTDKVLGVSYERLGHCTDSTDYFFTEFFDYLLT
ncbi:PBSX family phage terminase large subunit [Pontibacter beigongshangensis]|uniref:PBSX family phage terminase large subunit n=1 Tax=Pontibacter beigongshangensis TaxID=2574733 RepID=UPI00164F21AE|nr:PBSX family phage terminase large subunit [Pontibacter beigongshangensis]